MSQQGPILIVSTAERPSFATALDDAKLFPVIETRWADAPRAIEQLHPAAVLAAISETSEQDLDVLAKQIAGTKPYLPLIAVDPQILLPGNAIPFSHVGGNFDRLIARLRAALRVRTLHATVLRRLSDAPAAPTPSDTDPVRDATVLLIGRGAAYPALSVALGERMGIVGALSIEAAAKHLNDRDIDGIVLGEGFSPRVVDAFLTVLSEDSRFRHLPVVVTSDGLAPSYDLSNLEIITGEPAYIAANAVPLIRQHAFEVYLGRTLQSIDEGGLLDPQTGLLTPVAFNRDFATTVYQTLSRGGGLSVARFAFDPAHARAQRDGARIISRLKRKMDFGAVLQDGSVIVAFAETDLRTAHAIARRLSSVMRHTSHGKRETRSEPVITVATMLPTDSARSLLARLYEEGQRAAS
ncbi:GGDEF domain-containing protein [Bradyrhizobium canariense]|uniref:Two-component response regulator, PleD family, consists of two REC domains and a diguanylate cyclase (GGDEF) domain n=1 Tax=Bradyrhizobium canariense TaxID=255045 RepID=A0A1H1Q9Q4_9BRAD|nr:GGDEF domain-containing protein [Bradyrhizobium canariense]SDS19619.1 Two-component response regulator, PleD family, consists of two REC domains and a diguanylate cyclase (GGDEF) domain [Bradyrhizobium canariense]